jgi:hypothetical protein
VACAALAIGALLRTAPRAAAFECIEAPTVITSKVIVQVYTVGETPAIVPGATVELTTRKERRTVATGSTDDEGHLGFSGLPAGHYVVSVVLAGFPPFRQDVRVVERVPARLIAVGLTPTCHQTCAVAAPGGSLKRPPKCL